VVWDAPYAVVSEETIAPIFSPDPMPVEVIRALALDGALFELVPGEMTELMSLRPRVTLPDLSATSGQT
jgi:hypothetical protein